MPEQDWTVIQHKLSGIIRAATGITGHWVKYLIAPATDNSPELRNQILPILVSGMFDTVQGADDRLRQMIADSESLNYEMGAYYARAIRLHMMAEAQLLSIFSFEEMCFLTELRIQAVHGYIQVWNDPQRSVWRIEGVAALKSKIPPAEFNAAVNGVIAQHGTDEAALAHLRKRFCQTKSIFWTADAFLRMPLVRVLIDRDLAKFGGDPSGGLMYPESAEQLAVANEEHGKSLADIRLIANFGGFGLPDDVFN